MNITSHVWRRSMPTTPLSVNGSTQVFLDPRDRDVLRAATGFRLVTPVSESVAGLGCRVLKAGRFVTRDFTLETPRLTIRNLYSSTLAQYMRQVAQNDTIIVLRRFLRWTFVDADGLLDVPIIGTGVLQNGSCTYYSRNRFPDVLELTRGSRVRHIRHECVLLSEARAPVTASEETGRLFHSPHRRSCGRRRSRSRRPLGRRCAERPASGHWGESRR